ncbi:MAG: peptidylprolyl isomerase [Acidobacteria bacterium]|nr:peptidylprolyl isomerase [Acidobacteriota bacterium]
MSNRTAVIETNKGTIKFELLEQDAPKTTENFSAPLVRTQLLRRRDFHQVIKNFMIRAATRWRGATAANRPGAEDLMTRSTFGFRSLFGRLRKGTVAMANAGPNTSGSQFFANAYRLPSAPELHKVWQSDRGQSVVDAIAELPASRR